MSKAKEYTILAGSWFDREAGAVKAVGDVVEFTDKQAEVFGRRNLRGPDDAQPAAPVVDTELAELQTKLEEAQAAVSAITLEKVDADKAKDSAILAAAKADAELVALQKAKAAVDTELTALQKAKAAVDTELTKAKADLAKATKA